MSSKKHLTKLCKMYPLHQKYVPALPCETWDDRLCHQRSTYIYILMYHCIATNTTLSLVSKIVKRVVSYIICTLHAQIVPLQRIPISQMSMNWCIKNEWTVWIMLFVERVVGNMVPECVCLHLYWGLYESLMVLERPFGQHWLRLPNSPT